MNEINSLWDFVKAGGWAMWPLVACSIILWAVVFERFVKLWNLLGKCKDAEEKILPLIYKKQFDIVHDTNKNAKLPVEKMAFFAVNKRNQNNISNKLNTKRKELVQDVKKPLWILGTIGASAPFIGLFGTVVGIIRSFHNISITGTSGFTVVSAGISEALIATATGIVVAIIGVIFYNYFNVRANRLSQYLESFQEELIEALDANNLKTEKENSK